VEKGLAPTSAWLLAQPLENVDLLGALFESEEVPVVVDTILAEASLVGANLLGGRTSPLAGALTALEPDSLPASKLLC